MGQGMTKLEEMLETCGMTMYELSKRMGIHYSSVNKYARGESPITTMPLMTATRLAKALGVTTDEIYASVVEPIDKMDLQEGWNELPGNVEIFIDNGIVTDATKDGLKAQAMTPANGGWDSVMPVSVKDLKTLIRQGKLMWH